MAKPRKRPTNVSIDPGLLARARALNINLSQALEERLAELVNGSAGETWLKQNRAAIESYNARIAKAAILSDDETQF